MARCSFAAAGSFAPPRIRLVTLPRPASLSRRVVALLGVLLLVVVAPAGAAESDPAARRREVQRQKAQAAAKVDVLRASDEELGNALDDLEQDIRGQEARAASAKQAAAAATEQVKRAEAAEAATTAELTDLRSTMKSVAVDAYMQGPTKQLALAAEAGSLNELATKQYMIDVAANKGADTADRLRQAREDLEVQRAAAKTAEEKAVARRKAMDAELKDLKVAEAAKERVAASVEDRLEQTLAEVASLETVDQQLAADIAARQRRLAAQLAARRTTAAPARVSRAATRPGGSIALTTVRGITVASSIADNLEALLAAADADGFALSGGGYRSSDGQVAARRANCGTSDYDIYEKPASACSPPTARPGQSMHEQGLAIDFTSNGQLIQSRSNPAFGWLSRNAGRFGFANLPREPWHWSTNGN